MPYCEKDSPFMNWYNKKKIWLSRKRNDVSCYPVIHPVKEAGFTLVELAIVLVIIGLIIGGVLAGQSLIKAAELRALITQIGNYNTAVNTFRLKYNAMPGDMRPADAARFGLAASAGGTGLGDSNRLIQDPAGTNTPIGEILLFWRHLSEAELINGSYGQDITVSTAQAPGTIVVENDFPPAKSGSGSVIVGSDAGKNYFGLLGLSNGATGGAVGVANYYPIRTPSISGLDAYNIDQKMDDGRPLLGRVQARGYGGGDILAVLNGTTNFPHWTATATAPACVIGASWPIPPTDFPLVTYNLDASNGGTTPNCSMRFQFQ